MPTVTAARTTVVISSSPTPVLAPPPRSPARPDAFETAAATRRAGIRWPSCSRAPRLTAEVARLHRQVSG